MIYSSRVPRRIVKWVLLETRRRIAGNRAVRRIVKWVLALFLGGAALLLAPIAVVSGGTFLLILQQRWERRQREEWALRSLVWERREQEWEQRKTDLEFASLRIAELSKSRRLATTTIEILRDLDEVLSDLDSRSDFSYAKVRRMLSNLSRGFSHARFQQLLSELEDVTKKEEQKREKQRRGEQWSPDWESSPQRIVFKWVRTRFKWVRTQLSRS